MQLNKQQGHLLDFRGLSTCSTPIDMEEDLASMFQELTLVGQGGKGKAAKARGRSARLEALDDKLAALYSSNQPCSFHQFRAYIKSQGICLANCHAYGSQAALRIQLQQHRNLIVHKGEAKHFICPTVPGCGVVMSYCL